MPPNTAYVGRGSKWGNPYRVERIGAEWCVVRGRSRYWRHYKTRKEALEAAVVAYKQCYLGARLRREARRELAKKNLCCWCPLDQPCHADVLLEIANK